MLIDLQSDPSMSSVLNDKELMRAIQQGNISKVVKNPKINKLMKRKDLMGHKSGKSMTKHYSVPELSRMLEYCSKITHPPSTQMVLVRNG